MRYQYLSLALATLISVAAAAPSSPYAGHQIFERYEDVDDECVVEYEDVPIEASDSKVEVKVGQATPATAAEHVSGAPSSGSRSTSGSSSGDSPSQDSTSKGSTGQVSTREGSSGQGSTTGASTGQGSTAENAASTGSKSNATSASSIPAGAGVRCKKGCASWWAEAVNACWAYDWHVAPGPFSIASKHDVPGAYGVQLPDSIDFVPLINASTNLEALTANASYHSLLGYNEPDGDVPVDVDFAIKTWPAVVATGKRIGSPSSANPLLYESSWLQDFMKGITAIGSHVDFIAMHHGTPNGNVSQFKEYLETTHEKFGLPIWVTEWNWSNDPMPSDEDQVRYMQESVEMMNGLDFVERYSFIGALNTKMDLFFNPGNITKEGIAYKAL